MFIIGIMCIGILIGNRVFPEKYGKANEKLQMLCTVLLIFSMGVLLGKRENFFSELASLGIQSFLFFLFPTLLSLLAVYALTERFLKKENTKEEEGEP